MNKRPIWMALVITAAIVALVFIFIWGQKEILPKPNTPISNESEIEIQSMVLDFSSKLKNVSLSAEKAELKKQMESEYGPYLTRELLLEWETNPKEALGRSTSSPWPDRMELVGISLQTDGSYKVDGNIIEITSADQPGEPAAVYPVTLTAEKRGDSWLITSASKGAYSELPQKATITGRWECLPHRDTSGPQTMECAFGILSEDGKHYALNLSLMSSTPANYEMHERIRAQGVMVPANQLNSDMWQKYAIEGIIAATLIEKA